MASKHERALQRAHAEGIQIIGSSQSSDGQSIWTVWNPKHGSEGYYTVRQVNANAPRTCNCAARGYCKHVALVEESEHQAPLFSERNTTADRMRAERDEHLFFLTDLTTFSLWK